MAWRRRLPWVVVVAGGLLVSSCGDGTDGQYVKNTKAGVYLRVPDDWGVFTLQAGDPVDFRAKKAGSSGSVPLPPDPWRVAFDGADDPRRKNIEAPVPKAPIGMVEVYSLLQAELDSSFSTLAGLRTIAGGSDEDPLEREKEDEDFKVLDYKELELDDGFYGIRITFSEEGEDANGDPVRLTLTRIALLDDRLERLHLVSLQCESECYQDNEKEIDAIVDSFTVRSR